MKKPKPKVLTSKEKRERRDAREAAFMSLVTAMNNPCVSCQSHCCGGSPVGAPILTPDEMERFKDDSHMVSETHARMNRANGVCKWLKDRRCSIYEERPLECRLYPYVMQWDGKKVSLVLHSGCPAGLSFPKPDGYALPTDVTWLSGFNDLPV